MKVTSIGDFKHNRANYKSFHQEKIQISSPQMQSYPVIIMPNNYPIHFGSSLGFINAGKTAFRNFTNIPCPCCGIKMLPVNIFQNTLTKRFLSKPGYYALMALSEFEESMHPIERQCFDLLRQESKKEPSKNLQELLYELKPNHLKQLIGKQIRILNEVDKMGSELSDKSAQMLLRYTREARNRIIIPGEDHIFEIKPFLAALIDFKAAVGEKKVAERIFRKANELPRAGKDLDAFIVKYSRRDPKEIGQRLVSLSVGTIEHIKPRSNKGASMGRNYLLECGNCNHTRSDVPFAEWLKMRPEMVKNLQKYMDEIIKQINEGTIVGYEWYPSEVAATLAEESKGAVILDISKLTKSANYLNLTPLYERFSKNCITQC